MISLPANRNAGGIDRLILPEHDDFRTLRLGQVDHGRPIGADHVIGKLAAQILPAHQRIGGIARPQSAKGTVARFGTGHMQQFVERFVGHHMIHGGQAVRACQRNADSLTAAPARTGAASSRSR